MKILTEITSKTKKFQPGKKSVTQTKGWLSHRESPVHVSMKKSKPSGNWSGERKYPELTLNYVERCSPHHTVRYRWHPMEIYPGQAGNSHSCREGQVGGICEIQKNSCLWLSIPCLGIVSHREYVWFIHEVVAAKIGHWLYTQWDCKQFNRRLGLLCRNSSRFFVKWEKQGAGNLKCASICIQSRRECVCAYVSIVVLCVHKIVTGDVKGSAHTDCQEKGNKVWGCVCFGCCYTFGLLNHVSVLPIPK